MQIKKYVISLFTVLFCYTLYAQQTEKIYLSGTGEDNTVTWQFYCTSGMNSGKWTTIPVPSNWELQGFGKYNYGFSKDSARGKEKGLYKYQFSVPSSWKTKVVELVFEGVMTDCEVKINGHSAGPVHQGAYYRFKYDVSKLLKYGSDNLLEATVSKHSTNESVNAAERRGDFWIFGGIFRPVYLQAFPQQHIERVALNANADGKFNANVYINNASKNSKISAQIYSLDGKKIGSTFSTAIHKGDSIVKMNTTISSPKLWSTEFPNLYNVVFSIEDNGKIIHSITQRFGFRTIEIRERDGVYINGVKIKFKGVCRHSFWPSTGRTMSERRSLADVQMIKDMNMNAVRMSHYPGDDHFYNMCDSLGLFVLDELAGWHGHYDTPTGTLLAKAMIEKNENHPCIIMWDNGNEGGHNNDLDAVFDSEDIQHRHVIHPWMAFRGFDTQHYRDYNYGISNYMHGHDIVMPTEFLHGLYDGGLGAGLQDYWEAMWKDPLSAGGFLWDFADEGVVRTDENGKIDTDGDHGPDGIVGPYHQKEGSYFAIKEIWSPVVFEPKYITPAFNGKLNIENRFFFTNINQCGFTWRLSKLSLKGNESNPDKTGSAIAPNISPLEKGVLNLKLPVDWDKYDVLYVTAYRPDKKEIFTWSFPIILPEEVVKKNVVFENPGEVNFSEADSLYNVAANGVQLQFNKNTGLLQHVQNSKGEIDFNNGPVIQEGVNNFKDFTQRFEGKNVVIESKFDRKNAYNVLQWTIYPSGIVKMQVKYFPGEYFTNMVGVNFSFPEKEIKGVEYMGYGPYRVWKNRLMGNKFGIWNKPYNNTETGEAPWVYPEFKGYYSNMYRCKFITNSQSFTAYTDNEDLFLRLFTPAPKTDKWHNYEPKFPTGDISFMQAIPAIGTKTQRPETTGPMGEKNIFYDYEKAPDRCLTMTMYFDFLGDE